MGRTYFQILCSSDNKDAIYFSQMNSFAAKNKDSVAYWFLQMLINLVLKCRSKRLQTRSSAAPVRYLGHTPITERQRERSFCRRDIYLWNEAIPFEYYLVVILRPSPGRGLKQQAAAAERWQLGWLSLKVDMSSLYANALAPRQSSGWQRAFGNKRHESEVVNLYLVLLRGLYCSLSRDNFSRAFAYHHRR